VRWEDGIFQREVRRTTFAVDATAVEAAFEALAGFQAQQPLEESAADETQGRQGRRQTGAERRRQQQQQQSAPLPNSELPLQGEAGDEP